MDTFKTSEELDKQRAEVVANLENTIVELHKILGNFPKNQCAALLNLYMSIYQSE